MRYPRRSRRSAPAGVQQTLFDVELHPERRYYRQIFDALARSDFGSDPLAAELVVSRLCGTVWASQDGRRDGATEESFGLGMVEFARVHRAPTTVAILRTLACVAPIREVRQAARQAADAMSDSGIPGPRWQPAVGAVTPGRCWSYEDVYGDQATVICEFGYGDDLRTAPRHATVVQVDHATFSVASSALLSYDVDAVIRDLRNEAKTCAPMFILRQVEPGWARAVLGRAFARTDLIEEIVIGPGLADLRALALARMDTFPVSIDAVPPVPAVPNADHRRGLVGEFLSSSEAQPLASVDDAAEIAASIVDFGCERDPEAPSRVSPIKWDIYINDWLPRQAAVFAADDLRRVARVWSAWAGRRTDLPEAARDELLRSLDESLDTSLRPPLAAAMPAHS